MAVVSFTANLDRHVECPPRDVPASTVAEALAAVFADNPRLRTYVLDDQGRLRKHMLILIDGAFITDPHHLTDPLTPTSNVYIAQALSGG